MISPGISHKSCTLFSVRPMLASSFKAMMQTESFTASISPRRAESRRKERNVNHEGHELSRSRTHSGRIRVIRESAVSSYLVGAVAAPAPEAGSGALIVCGGFWFRMFMSGLFGVGGAGPRSDRRVFCTSPTIASSMEMFRRASVLRVTRFPVPTRDFSYAAHRRHQVHFRLGHVALRLQDVEVVLAPRAYFFCFRRDDCSARVRPFSAATTRAGSAHRELRVADFDPDLF